MEPNPRTLVGLSALLVSLVVGGIAAAAPPQVPAWDSTAFVPKGAVRKTGISGRSGTLRLASPPQAGFLGGIVGLERQDRPCETHASYWYEEAKSPREPRRMLKNATVRTRECPNGAEGNYRSREHATIASGAGSLRFEDGSMRAAAGVQVCMNSSGNRIKGIRCDVPL